VELGAALKKMDLPVIIADPNNAHLRTARDRGIDTFYGDILSEAAEDRVDLVIYEKLICASDNDAYNTLVATDLAPEFGRENVFQIKRVRETSSRHSLPVTLGGQGFGPDETFLEANAAIAKGCEFRVTRLSDEFTLDQWREAQPGALALAELAPNGALRLLGPEDDLRGGPDTRILSRVTKRPERDLP